MPKRHVTRFSLCVLLLFLFSAFIVACGSSNASTSPKKTVTPPTPSPVPTITLTTYKGTGFSMGYPKGWTTSNSSQQIQFTDSLQDNLSIETKTGKPNISTIGAYLVQLTLAALKVGGKNYKEISVPSKTTIDGAQWDQGAATMTDPQLGPIQITVLGTQNPKHPGQLFILFYGTSQKTFAKINSEDFQPMLQSFKFQS
jgi:hypothetical protein